MIYLDCGYYDGTAERLNCVRDDWIKYGFEANPNIKVPKHVKHKAVWTKGGKAKLTLHALRNDSASLEGMAGQAPGMKQLEVRTFDFSKFVSKLPIDQIVCSMDIEGAEFVVLEKMLKEDTLDNFVLLDIEFHHRLMNDYTSHDAQSLIDRIQALGVVVRLKTFL